MKFAAATMSSGVAALSCLAIAAAVTPLSCSDALSHIYVGRLFDPTRGCLAVASSVDVVEGDDPGLGCARTCLVAPSVDGGPPPIYVSTMCPPYPPLYDVSGTSPSCALAIAASTRSDICEDDGGSSNPLRPDAGADASPANDAAEPGDAAPDASDDAPNDGA